MKLRLRWLPLCAVMTLIIGGTQLAVFLFWKQILPFWFLGGILAGLAGGFLARDWKDYALGAVPAWLLSTAGVAVVTILGSKTDLARHLFYFALPLMLVTPMMLAIFGILGLFIVARDPHQEP